MSGAAAFAGVAGFAAFRDCSQRLRFAAERDRELVDARQLFEVPQGKLLEKQRRGSVEQRTAEALAARHDFNKTTFEQRFENRACIDAADVRNFGAADRLAVRNDRERLERRAREPLRPDRHARALDRLRVFGAREDLPSSALLHELDAVLALLEHRARLRSTSTARIVRIAPSTSSARGTTSCSVGLRAARSTRSTATSSSTSESASGACGGAVSSGE